MKQHGKVWIGIDPGGAGNFGVAILQGGKRGFASCVSDVDEAMDVILKQTRKAPDGVGVDAPLWWSSGPSGLRRADQWIRAEYHLPSRKVQAVNSMWGSVLAQGMMIVACLREHFPHVPVTETHPKALLRTLNEAKWQTILEDANADVTLHDDPNHKRDAVLSAIAAREGFEGRWIKDLTTDRFSSEQNPGTHWIGPVRYFWPDPSIQENRRRLAK